MGIFLIRVIRVIRGSTFPMLLEEITKNILGAAVAVLNELRPDSNKKAE